MNATDQRSIPAVYMRGGTSRALIFQRRHLPPLDDPRNLSAWNGLFLKALGSPDPSGRQLDGLGGGLSSLSKIAIVEPSTRPDADVDFTFGQVAIDSENVSYKGNCGNISAAIGPYAIDEGLATANGDSATVRIHNTNTGKIIVSEFGMAGGKAAVHGDYVIQGVAGSGAPIKLSFLQPGGAVTGKLFPSGRVRQPLLVPLLGPVEVSLLDAANPVVFVHAQSVGMTGKETPSEIAANADLQRLLQALRVSASLEMGVAHSEEDARNSSPNLPLVAIISPPLEGGADDDDRPMADISVRMISAGLPHKATPLTGAMCTAVAARIAGTVVHDVARRNTAADDELHIEHPSGIMQVAARVSGQGIDAVAEYATVYRTARRLMEGKVFIPD